MLNWFSISALHSKTTKFDFSNLVWFIKSIGIIRFSLFKIVNPLMRADNFFFLRFLFMVYRFNFSLFIKMKQFLN